MELQQYCEKLKHFNNEQLQIIKRRAKEQINKNIARTVQEEDLAFQEAVRSEYSYYCELTRLNLLPHRLNVRNWSFQQFRDFYEEHTVNWLGELRFLAGTTL